MSEAYVTPCLVEAGGNLLTSIAGLLFSFCALEVATMDNPNTTPRHPTNNLFIIRQVISLALRWQKFGQSQKLKNFRHNSSSRQHRPDIMEKVLLRITSIGTKMAGSETLQLLWAHAPARKIKLS